jgi:hypothetical protein
MEELGNVRGLLREVVKREGLRTQGGESGRGIAATILNDPKEHSR